MNYKSVKSYSTNFIYSKYWNSRPYLKETNLESLNLTCVNVWNKNATMRKSKNFLTV